MDHKKLEVWKKSIEFVKEIYKLTEEFPSSEGYGLTNQIRRAAVSIPSNIAEGAARLSDKEFIQFLNIALGSCAEVETQLIIANDLNFIEDVSFILTKLVEIRKMITGLISYLKNKLNED